MAERNNNLTLFQGDVSEAFFRHAIAAGSVAWDIETSGLDWRKEKIGTCQLCTSDNLIAVVVVQDSTPFRLMKLLEDTSVRKIFHHAMFDLRFMRNWWNGQMSNVACTKIASKLLWPERENHSLQPLLREILGIEIAKSLQKSDWMSGALTADQVAYAVGDVRYLHRLLDALAEQLRETDRTELLEACFRHIPTRVILDVGGYSDVYQY